MFKEYLNSKGIILAEPIKLPKNKNISAQLGTIARFHSRAAGYREYGGKSLKDNIGKDIEKSKVELKKTKKLLDDIKLKGPQNMFEEVLLFNSGELLEKAQKALSVSGSEKYLDIIKRSMSRGEVCIGDPFFKNISEGSNIIVSNIDNCSYNLVESDGITFFRKLRRKAYKFDLKRCIDEYCNLEGLDSFSREYISSLMEYPYNTIKYCIRYKDSKYILDASEYLNKYKKVCSYDS